MIIVVDMGGQYSHLIARRIRNLGVYSQLVPPSIPVREIKRMNPEGIILSGGPKSVYASDGFKIKRALLNLGIPVLGICYGHQLLAHFMGGKVVPGSKEYGRETLEVGRSRILRGLKKKENVWASHGDEVFRPPRGFRVVGKTEECKIAVFENNTKKIYGMQFHPEVHHTPGGRVILENFLKICGCKKKYSFKGMGKRLVKEIKNQIGAGAVIMAVSGGVDSLVASVLIRKATPDIYCVFVDNGLIRKGEKEEVAELYRNLGFRHFYAVDSASLFLDKLKGVEDPERKRKIIGETFIKVFESKADELKKRHEIKFLGQGTIYPDRIESAKSSPQADVIKTHHNVGGLPEEMKLELVEPLKDLYKDEVRHLGRLLRIERKNLYRHPFPGPGLGVRIIGEVTAEKAGILREADAIFMDELKKSGYYEKTWQAFAALLPLKAVGVMGDSRTEGHIIALRAVTSIDAMTADWARLPAALLERVSNRITKQVKGVARVVYDITQKPPGTIEFE